MGNYPQTPSAGLPTTAGMDQILKYAEMLPADDPDRANLIKAALICNAPQIPVHARGKPMSVMFMMLRARELGMPFGMALQVIYPTPGGNLGLEAKAMRALLIQAGCTVEYPVNEAEKVVCNVTRPGVNGSKPQSYAATWTKARAEAYPVWLPNKQDRDGPKERSNLAEKWRRSGQELQNMLRQRACSEAAREIAPDIIGGMYTSEEAIDIDHQPEALPPATTEEKLEAMQQQAAVSDDIDEALISIADQQKVKELAHKAGVPIATAINVMLDICMASSEQDDPKAYVNASVLKLIEAYSGKLEAKKPRSKPAAAKTTAEAAKALAKQVKPEVDDFVESIGDPDEPEGEKQAEPSGDDPFSAELPPAKGEASLDDLDKMFD